MLQNLRSQGRKARTSALDQYNMALGSSGAMSGAGRSATEGIAAQEAVDASGINALAADAQAERDIYQKKQQMPGRTPRRRHGSRVSATWLARWLPGW